MQEKRVRVDHIELQIRDYQHEGDAIVFLHFSGANLMMWQGAVPYFQGHYRLILVDLRGHGRSDTPANGYHMDHMAYDVAGIMTAIKLERAHIIGSSLGAEVGLSLAATYPEKKAYLKENYEKVMAATGRLYGCAQNNDFRLELFRVIMETCKDMDTRYSALNQKV